MSAVVVKVDDWAGLYIDGKLVSEGHSISTHDLVVHGVLDEDRGLDGTPFEQELINHGGMPKNLDDVPKGR